MSQKMKTKLVHIAVVTGLLLVFFSAPMIPGTNGDCSVPTLTCGGG
ncbi:MAG: hypothetical protein H6657_06185 [Ardenticatenaceae bacterium]|nr:hypothetical protein [Anaerolineales bacterium]MCB8977000.1 hypothetical protein [Ardenticatenaceae bacterium]